METGKGKQGKPIITGKRSENKNFVSVLDKATRETIEKYKIVRPGLSESIIRNFVINLAGLRCFIIQ